MTNAGQRIWAKALMGYGVIGSPADSGSVSLGSSPGTPANVIESFKFGLEVESRRRSTLKDRK